MTVCILFGRRLLGLGGLSPYLIRVVDALKLQKERQDRARDKAGEFWEEWGLVFTTAVGTPVSPRNDYREFQKIISVLGCAVYASTTSDDHAH